MDIASAKSLLTLLVALAAAASPSTSASSEVANYSYDASGRVVNVTRSGSVNNGLRSTYIYDLADNRNSVSTTGASAYSSTHFVVVPLNGYTLIPIAAGLCGQFGRVNC